MTCHAKRQLQQGINQWSMAANDDGLLLVNSTQHVSEGTERRKPSHTPAFPTRWLCLLFVFGIGWGDLSLAFVRLAFVERSGHKSVWTIGLPDHECASKNL